MKIVARPVLDDPGGSSEAVTGGHSPGPRPLRHLPILLVLNRRIARPRSGAPDLFVDAQPILPEHLSDLGVGPA
ncbi:MAG: hypothetical protein J0626_04470, partial [Rhodospirillaceae bacterium]|nr:hypothetical protein [Rhodospirillaceae bacterium]